MPWLSPQESEFSLDNWICSVQETIVCKSSASPPPAVDPTALAQAQTQSNISTAKAQANINNSNTFSPLGTSIWTQSPTGQYGLTQSLSPQEQALLSGQQMNSQAGLGLGGQALSLAPSFYGGLMNPGPLQSSAGGNFADQIQQAQNAAYNANTQYLNPQYAEQSSNLQQQLADQGINPNNAAYSRATGDLARNQQLGYNAAQNAAVLAGNQEQNTLFGQSLSNAQLANQAQQQRFGEAATGLGSILGAGTNILGATNPSGLNWASGLPTYGGQNTTVSPTNVIGAQQVASQNAQNQFSDANTLNNQLFNGLGSLGSTLGITGPSGSATSLLSGLFGAGTAAAAGGGASLGSLGGLAAAAFL